MAGSRLIAIRSIAELRSVAASWDDLWQRSDAVLPTARAELLAVWTEHFAPRAGLQFLAVEDDGRWIAALPLVVRRWLPGWPVAELAGNHWTPSGDLLLDPAADTELALDLLAGELCRLPVALVHLPAIDAGAARWRHWLSALEHRGVACLRRPRIEVPLAHLGERWPAYVSSLSRNHRRQLRRAERDAEKLRHVELRVLDNLTGDQLETALRRAFEVEHRNWKGRAASSVLSQQEVVEFFLAQARQLAAGGESLLSFLELADRPVAFEYGWLSKGVYQVLKIGYDEAYAHISPGHLLRWRLLEHLHEERGCRTVDFLGPRTRATDSWANDAYVLSRVLMAPRRLVGRLALRAYAYWRRRSAASASPATQRREPVCPATI